MRIVLTGGGTGGIFSDSAVAREIKKQIGEKEDMEFLISGSGWGTGKRNDGKGIYSHEKNPLRKIAAVFFCANFLDVFKIPLGFLQSLWHLLVLCRTRFLPKADTRAFRWLWRPGSIGFPWLSMNQMLRQDSPIR